MEDTDIEYIKALNSVLNVFKVSFSVYISNVSDYITDIKEHNSFLSYAKQKNNESLKESVIKDIDSWRISLQKFLDTWRNKKITNDDVYETIASLKSYADKVKYTGNGATYCSAKYTECFSVLDNFKKDLESYYIPTIENKIADVNDTIPEITNQVDIDLFNALNLQLNDKKSEMKELFQIVVHAMEVE